MITYVVCLYRPEVYARVCEPALEYQRDRFGAQIIVTDSEIGICDAYEKARVRACNETVVYLHDDVEMLDWDASVRILDELRRLNAGLLGVVGSLPLSRQGGTPSLPWWDRGNEYGGSWCYVSRKGQRVYQRKHGEHPTEPYVAQRVATTGLAGHLDGLLLADRTNLPWPAKQLRGWHGYDAWRCEQVRAYGHRVVTGDVMIAHHNQPHSEDWARALEPALQQVRNRWHHQLED